MKNTNLTYRFKHLLAALCDRIGLVSLLVRKNNKLNHGRYIILIYHRLRPQEGYIDTFSQDVLGPTVSLFKNQMLYLKERYNVVSLDKIVGSLKGENSLPPNAVAITFDDGYKDTYALAYPILKKYGLPATVFLTTGFVGTKNLLWFDKVAYLLHQTRRQDISLNGASYSLLTPFEKQQAAKGIIDALKQVPEERKLELLEELRCSCEVEVNQNAFHLALSWRDVREMARDDITFGAHTVTHPILTRVPKEVARLEILESKLTIENEVGKQVNIFAYPNGEPGDFDKEIQNVLKECGFDAACSSIHGPNSRDADRFALRRIWIGPHDNLPIFKAKLAGILPLKIRPKRALHAQNPIATLWLE